MTRTANELPEVVVLGAGFGGLNAVRKLASAPVRITVIDGRNHHLFQPLLYQVATAALDPSDIAYPIRAVFRKQANVERVLLARAQSIDLAEKNVHLEDGETISFDKLIVATGATHSYFGNDAWEQHAPGLKTIEDALDMRRRILSAFESAERDAARRDALLTFVVVGAGPTGVELAGALVEIAVDALADDFDVIDPSKARVVLVEGSPRVLPVYPDDLSAKARRQLETLGVEVRTEAMVTHIDDQGVTLKDGTHIPSHTVLWAAGVQASPLVKSMGCELDRVGRVLVTPDLSVPGHPDVFVVGDVASVTVDDKPVPGVAPAAIQGGGHVGAQILRDLQGKERRAFRYRDKGSLATIGRVRAVADFGKLRFGGPIAWLAWMLIHIFFLIGFRNRLFVGLSWGWAYVTFHRGARLITGMPRRPTASDKPPRLGGDSAPARCS